MAGQTGIAKPTLCQFERGRRMRTMIVAKLLAYFGREAADAFPEGDPLDQVVPVSDFGSWLRNFRIRQGLRQAEIAEALGVLQGRHIGLRDELYEAAGASAHETQEGLWTERGVRPVPMIAERIEAAKQVDWWLFIRLLITAAVLGLAAHAFVGWQPRPRELIALSGQMVGVLAILAMISFALADLYLLAFLSVPLYVLAVLNDWTYSVSFWAGRTMLRLRSP